MPSTTRQRLDLSSKSSASHTFPFLCLPLAILDTFRASLIHSPTLVVGIAVTREVSNDKLGERPSPDTRKDCVLIGTRA